LLFSVALVTSSIREFLFGNGLYVYKDWTWPLSTSLTPVSSFSPNIITNFVGPDPLGFVRMFITWPIVVIDDTTGNTVLAEKAYVLYFFSIFIFLFFILAELLVRLLDKERKIAISPWKRELFVLSVVLLSFINFWALNELSDFYFVDVIAFALICISMILPLAETGLQRTAILPGALLALCVFLNPDMYPYGLIAVALVIVGTSMFESRSVKKVLRSLARIPVMLALTLPSLLTMLFVFSISTGTNLRPLNTFQASTGNLALTNALRLFGYWWSNIAYSPPSLIMKGSVPSSLDSIGAPPFILLPLGVLTMIWLISTWVVPAMSIGTALFAPFRRLTVPVAFVAVIGLLFTQPSIFPYPYRLAAELQGTPLIGGALVTFLAIPDHALIIVASSFTILVAIGIYSLMTSDLPSRLAKFLHVGSKFRTSIIGTTNVSQVVPVLTVLALLVFSGWQFFSGSFYPSGYIWGGSGNGVSNVGAFSPAQTPPGMVQVYDWMLLQPGEFNIYWPGPNGAAYPWSEKATGGIAFQDSPKPEVFPRALPYLISSNLTADIKDYLSALNVKYLVVQPFSSIAMQYDWGVGDVASLNKILQSVQGLTLVQNVGDITVYQVDNPWGVVYSSPLVASYNASDSKYAIAYGVFKSLGTRIALTDVATSADQLCIDNMTCSIDLVPPDAIALQASFATGLETLNDTSISWPDFVLDAGTSKALPGPTSLWEVSNWQTRNATVGITNGVMKWTFNHASTYLSLSYNGTVSNHNIGGVSIPLNEVVSTQVGFWYKTSGGFDGSLQIVIPYLNPTGTTIAEPVSPNFTPSLEWRFASFNMTLPTDASYFTARFAAQASTGSVEIRDARIGTIFLHSDSRAPFGFTMPVRQTFDLGLPNEYMFIEFQGNGSLDLNGQTFSFNSPNELSWFSLHQEASSFARLSGSGIIAAMIQSRSTVTPLSMHEKAGNEGNLSIVLTSTNSVVFARPFTRGYSLTSSLESFSPHQTMDGLNLFKDVSSGDYSVSFPQIGYARTAYLVSLGAIFGVVLGSSLQWLLPTFVSRQKPPPDNETRASVREIGQVEASIDPSSET